MGPAAREHTRVRGERPRSCRSGLVEADSLFSQSLEIRACAALVAVEAQVIGPHRVQHDQEHVGRVGGRQGTALLSPSLEPVSPEDPARLNHDHHEKDRQAQRHPSSHAGRMPLEHPGQARRDP